MKFKKKKQGYHMRPMITWPVVQNPKKFVGKKKSMINGT